MSRQDRRSQRARAGQGPLGKLERLICGLVHRVRVVATQGALWKVEGHTDFNGNVSSYEAETFEGIGFASRPGAADNAEVIVLQVEAASGHPVIVATRNRDALKKLIQSEGLEADETVIFASASMVKIKADGTIELGSIGGTFQPLATKSDIDALKAIFDAWVVAGTDGGGALKTLLEAWTPVGTVKVRAE